MCHVMLHRINVNKRLCQLFVGVAGESTDWYVRLDCIDNFTFPFQLSNITTSQYSPGEDIIIPHPARCGRTINTPCCHIDDILDHIQEGDIVTLQEYTKQINSYCNITKEIQVNVTKSFILKTLSVNASTGMSSMQNAGLYGMKIIFNSNCSERCSVTISKSQFTCSFIEFNNLDVWIKDSQFNDSYIAAVTQLGNYENGFKMEIQDSEFQNSFQVNINGNNSMNNGPCKHFNYVCLSGNWNLLAILGSNFEGNRQSRVSGAEIMHANIQTLDIINDRFSSLFSALVIWSSSVGIFNVTDSVFLDNRDGIDFGQAVRYMVVNRSEMNSTGSWFVNGDSLEQCSSALKGTVQNFKVEDSVFAHNHAYGVHCTGSAISLRSNIYSMLLLEESKDQKFEQENLPIQMIDIAKSVFYENAVENCSVRFGKRGREVYHYEDYVNNGGAAISVYGAHLVLQIVASSFVRNEACKGAGLYVGISDRWLRGYSKNSAASQVMSSRIIIDMCMFNENIADFGGGLMTEFSESKLDSGSSMSTLINNSSFYRNNATYRGAGAHVNYFNVSINNEAIITIKFSNTDFKDNIVNRRRWKNVGRGKIGGGGISMWFESMFLMFSASIQVMVYNCSFTSNKASTRGAGISTWLETCSVHSKSSIQVLVYNCSFTSNKALGGAGIATQMETCSAHSRSAIMLKVTSSIFKSNTAKTGAGIDSGLESCSADSDSSFILQTIGSTFTSGKAERGAGIYMYMYMYFNYNPSVTVQMNDSIFTSNTVRSNGAGIYIAVKHLVDAYSYIKVQTINSTFRSNFAEEAGAGIYIEETILPPGLYIHRHFSFQFCVQVQAKDCTFISNRADYGPGLSLLYSTMDIDYGCVSGDSNVGIYSCRFLNNSASREGGSLYFQASLPTLIYVGQCVFENNRALPGSGLYRENIDFPTCESHTYLSKPKTTSIVLCWFIENIDTAIMMKSKQRYGTLSITNCSFKNNRCINSSFAEDIFTEIDLELDHTNILKDSSHQGILSINAQSDSKLNNVSVITESLSNQRQISIALFSHYTTIMYPSNSLGYCKIQNTTYSHSLEYKCPSFYKPSLSTAGLTNNGAARVQITCDTCFQGYYMGKSRMVITTQNDSDTHCQEKTIRKVANSITYTICKNMFCYTKSMGICIECPHGANCSAGVVTLPNYWGHMSLAGRLEFHRCPVGYCCNRPPCKDIAQCVVGREGTLCGRCMKGFTESLITPKCIPDETCSDWWIFPLFCVWALAITLVILFTQDIVRIKEIINMRLKGCKSIPEHANKMSCDASNGIDLKRIDSVEIHRPNFLTLKCDLWEQKVKRRHSIEIQPIQHVVSSCNASKIKSTYMQSKVQNSESPVKAPILRRLLSIERKENVQASGSHKYLQIMLFFLQDAAIMQIDLALVSTITTPIQKLRQFLLNVSKLAVDLIDLGLNLCPFPGWTPVSKLLTKSLTGPFVFSYIFAIYGIVRMVCHCFPSKRKYLRDYWYPRLTSAAVFSTLLFYQQIASVALSLLFCIKSGDKAILFIDGNVTCYQPWQILAFIFGINWIVGIIPVLMFLPGLLELKLIRVSHFIIACMMPVPMLFYWLFKFYRQKLRILSTKDSIPPWHKEILKILQTTFAKTTDRKGLPFCWIGFMKIRRLALVLLFTFVSNLVARVSFMCLTIVIFLLFHLETKPYQDDTANNLYTGTLLATLAIGFINIMKASCVEFYLDLDKVAHYLTTLNMITDGILVYCPLGFVGLTIVATLISKVKQIVLKKHPELCSCQTRRRKTSASF